MLEAIRDYIKEHLRNWNTSPRISCSAHWQPIFRSNINYNFVEEYPPITRIIFWIDGAGPKLVTKIVDKSLSREAINACQVYQLGLNEQLGYDLFPLLYDIADINGCCVLFEPALQKSTYETELKRAVFGPEASLPYLGRVVIRQFAEIGQLFEQLQQIIYSSESKQWGQTFSDLGGELKTVCDIGDDILSSEHLDKMRQDIDLILISDTPIIADLVCPNIFPGPQLIDNLVPDINGLNESLPGIINAFRFMVLCFYSPPLTSTLQGWVHALAGALMDKEEASLLAKPVRNMCRRVGLEPDYQYDTIWALIMGATFFEMLDKLDFYKNSPFMLQGKQSEYLEWTKTLVAVQESLK